MRCNRRNKYDRIIRMAKTPSSGQIVRRGARWCCDADSVRLHSGEVLVVSKHLDAAHCGIWSTVQHDVVQNVVRAIRVMSVHIIAAVAYELINKVAGLLLLRAVSGSRAHYGPLEA